MRAPLSLQACATARVWYHEQSVEERAAAADSAPSGEIRLAIYPPYLNDAQLTELRNLMVQIDQARAASTR